MTHAPATSPIRPACLALLLSLGMPAHAVVQQDQVAAMAMPADGPEEVGPSCFTMEAPGKGWRPLKLVELRALDPEAQVGLAGPHGLRSVLSAEVSNNFDLAACVRQLIDDQNLVQVSFTFEEPTRIEGRDAAHALVTGRRDGIWWRYHATAFREGRELYLLLSWGRSDDVPADGSTLLEAAFGLKRIAGVGLEELQRAGSALDADGPGWRVRGGIYRDAALGFELHPRGAWRVASRRELARLGPDVSAGLIDELHDAVLGFVAERVPTDYQSQHADSSRRLALAEGHQAGSRTEHIADREIDLRRITLAGPTGYGEATVRMLYGMFFEGDRCFEIRARFAANLEPAMDRSLPQGLASLRLLGEPERMELAEELTREAILPEAVGDGWSLRNGVFTDFRNGFQWRVPGGFWEVTAADLVDGQTLEMYERLHGVRGWIRVDEGASFAGAEGHARALEYLDEEREEVDAEQAVQVQLGSMVGLMSNREIADRHRPQRALMASTGDEQRSFRICFSASPETLHRNFDSLTAAVAALDINAEFLTPTVMGGGRYVDARMGFELVSPDPAWLFSERKLDRFGANAESAEGVMVSFEGRGEGGVYVSAAWKPGGPGGLDQPLHALLPTPLQSALELPLESPSVDQVATLHGHPCRLLTWQAEGRRIELVILLRASSAFGVAVVATDRESSPRKWLAGFRLLD